MSWRPQSPKGQSGHKAAKRGEGPVGSIWPLLRVNTEVKSPEVPMSARLSREPSSSHPVKEFEGNRCFFVCSWFCFWVVVFFFLWRSPFLIVLHLLKPCFCVSGVEVSRKGFSLTPDQHMGKRRMAKWCIEDWRGVKDCSCRTEGF